MRRAQRPANVPAGAVAFLTMIATAAAQDAEVQPIDGGTILLQEVTVSRNAAISAAQQVGPPPPASAGGQVAEGARLGVLGNRNIFDTPFSQTSYTGDFIESVLDAPEAAAGEDRGPGLTGPRLGPTGKNKNQSCEKGSGERGTDRSCHHRGLSGNERVGP